MTEEKTRLEAGAQRLNKHMKKLTASVASILHFARIHKDLRAYEYILAAEEVAERIVIELRKLARVTGNPRAVMDVECIMAKEIPVEMGYTKEGWFHLRFPRMLPKKEGGSAEYVRGFLYPAIGRYFRTAEYFRRFSRCTVIFRHVFDETCPENWKRDHDNIELNMVVDTIAVHVMEDDAAQKCRHVYYSVPGPDDHTEVYVIPDEDWQKWVMNENNIPGTGMQIEEDTSFLNQMHM